MAQHYLNLHKECKPVRHKLRRFHPTYKEVIKQEVEYPEWLSNVVVVPKKNGKWRVCVNYSNQNDACPKDTFPLPRINRIVDATTSNQLLSFLDAYSSYNKILMYPSNLANTTFITLTGMYCYNVMPFGLKKAGATYQRMMSCIFEPLLGRTMEAYIDNMLVKSRSQEDYIPHLRDAFQLIRLHHL